jgi:hypothetical protein
MTDIASSLEQEFADRSQADRTTQIAELKQIESKGRGSVAIVPHGIVAPMLFGLVGAILAYASIILSAWSATGRSAGFLAGAALVVGSVWLMFGPRKTCFTLTEEGVRTTDSLLPWNSIQDFGVTVHSINFVRDQTSIQFLHTAGFEPPPLGLFYMFGQSHRDKKTGLYSTNFTLYFSGAKGMNGDKLSQRIGEFFAAARARAELVRLNAN